MLELRGKEGKGCSLPRGIYYILRKKHHLKVKKSPCFKRNINNIMIFSKKM